jgi:hypothetical protein
MLIAKNMPAAPRERYAPLVEAATKERRAQGEDVRRMRKPLGELREDRTRSSPNRAVYKPLALVRGRDGLGGGCGVALAEAERPWERR